MQESLILFFAMAPVGLAAGLLASRVVPVLHRAWIARTWPSVVGRVLIAEVQERQVRLRLRTSLARYRDATRYAPRIMYEYQVNGVHYRAERIFLGPLVLTSSAGEAARAAQVYLPGSRVIVYYNPADPADAVLVPHLDGIAWVEAGVALFLFLVFAWLLWIIIK